MKIKIFLIVLVGIAGIVGYSLGNSIGSKEGFESAKRMNDLQPIESLKVQLKTREIAEITPYIHGKAGISKEDIGGLFSIKYAYYFEGTLSNSAAVARAKDVKLNIDFISKTGSKIGSKEIIIYDYINPGGTLSFKERIEVPANYEKIEFSILGAIGE